MSSLASKKRRRNRNKSSPTDLNKKKCKSGGNSDSEQSFYLDSETDSSGADSNMASSSFTDGDLVKLGNIISSKLKGEILTDIKTDLINIIRVEIRAEMKEIKSLSDKVTALESENQKLKAN